MTYQPVARPAEFAPHVVYPHAVVSAAEQPLAPAPPPGMRVIGYVRVDGMLHPQYGPLHEPLEPAPPPAPAGLDPQAQRTAAKGVLAAGAGIGAYFGMQALQILVDSLVQLLTAAAVCAVARAVVPSGRRSARQGTTYITNNRGAFAGWKSQNGPRK
ncbi:hypothetical protein [Streptomyces flaveolus]|uniref:hypothetical protein n=1 Tax=Streptomyces flaveolus TaxID=67297 RepID=UPI00167060AA|nr:hypothetical protein [Streptomyces flaveolus]GGQ81174.1 hypothetical protein GCM10010216_48770 [Streptomyces flaveolus]